MKQQVSLVPHQHQLSQDNQRKELSMTLVLVCIVVMFILCQSVKIIPDVYEAVVCDHTAEVRVQHAPIPGVLEKIGQLGIA